MPKGTSTYATVQADGSVLFDFPGHVQAQGIDLLAGTTNAPPNDRRIRWHKDPDFAGAVLAEIYGFSGGPTNSDTILHSISPAGTGDAKLDLFASDLAAVTPSQFIVTLDTGNAQAVVLDADQKSQFLQDGQALSGLRRFRFWGNFTFGFGPLAAGTVTVFTVVHNLGIFAGPFCGHIGGNVNGVIWTNTALTANSFDLALYNATPAPQSGAWNGGFFTLV